MWFVVLTAAQRTAARGKISTTDALEPIRAMNGDWLLPARCLVDILRHRPALAATVKALPRRDITDPAELVNGADVDAAELVRVGQIEATKFRGVDAGDVTEAAAKA